MRILITLLIILISTIILVYEGKMFTLNGYDMILIALAIYNSIHTYHIKQVIRSL